MIKIEFPADRPDIARHLGEALLKISGSEPIAEAENHTGKTAVIPEHATRAVGGEACGEVQPTESPSKYLQTIGRAPHYAKPGAKSLFDEEPKTQTAEAPSKAHADGAAERGLVQPDHDPDLRLPDRRSTERDMKGVSHNPEFCGNAARPFYTSGKRQGQWKKRQGADEAAYDAWYAEQLAAIEGNDEEEDDLPPISTAGAFGAKPAPAAEPCPDNTGAYMGWVSEKMAAGLLTQADTDEAHRRFGITLGHLFPPTPPAEVQQHIENLHRALSAVATSRTAGA